MKGRQNTALRTFLSKKQNFKKLKILLSLAMLPELKRGPKQLKAWGEIVTVEDLQ